MNTRNDRAVGDVASSEAEATRDVLLFDGLCNFCDSTVQFILARDRKATLQFAPLQGEFAHSVLERHPELASIDSLVLLRTGQNGAESVLVRTAAALALAEYLGGFWRLLGAFASLLPRPVRDRLYDALARRRIRIFGSRDACRLPSATERSRFLD